MSMVASPISVSLIAHGQYVRSELYRYGRGWVERIAEHAHSDFQFGYSGTGTGGFKIAGRWHDTIPGQVHCVSAFCEHTTGKEGILEKPADYHVVYVSPDYMSRLLGEKVGGNTPVFCATPRIDASRILMALGSPSVNLEDVDEMVLTLLFSTSVTPCISYGRSRTIALEARDYLFAHLDRGVSLTELGRACGVSPSRVRGAFKEVFGVPPHRFVLMERLTRARTFLASGGDISSVASRLGFVDQSHLTRLMRRYFGHTPGAILRT